MFFRGERNMNAQIRRANSQPNMSRTHNKFKMLKESHNLEMAFADETPILPLNLKKTCFYFKFKSLTDDTSIVARSKFCKTCCKPCHRTCPRAKYASDKAHLKARQRYERSDNFVVISAKYIMEFYHWTQNCMFKRLVADDFLKSIVASAALFAIGMKLTLELNAWSLSRTFNR